jgi:hypothetical protein
MQPQAYVELEEFGPEHASWEKNATLFNDIAQTVGRRRFLNALTVGILCQCYILTNMRSSRAPQRRAVPGVHINLSCSQKRRSGLFKHLITTAEKKGPLGAFGV